MFHLSVVNNRRYALILSHYRGGRPQPDSDAAALVDKRALGGTSSDDILGGQYRRHLRPLRQVCLQAMQCLVLNVSRPQACRLFSA
jgi:hypothetical protein